MVALGSLLHGQNLWTEKVAKMVRRHTHKLLHVNFFGHAEVDASGLTLFQPIIKNVLSDTVIALEILLSPACKKHISLPICNKINDKLITNSNGKLIKKIFENSICGEEFIIKWLGLCDLVDFCKILKYFLFIIKWLGVCDLVDYFNFFQVFSIFQNSFQPNLSHIIEP